MYKMNDQNKLSGELTLKVYRNGALIEEFAEKNLILSTGKELLAKLLAGTIEDKITHVGMGSRLDEPVPGDTMLTNMVMVPVTDVEISGQAAIFSVVVDNQTANGLDSGECGLLSGHGTLFSRRVRVKPLPKDEEIYFSGTWTIRF